MIVLDASAALHLVVASSKGAAVAERIADPGVTLHAPHLIDLEVAQVLRRYLAAGIIDASRGDIALDALASLGIRRCAHDVLLPRIWALRANLTAYDAAYVALAELLRAPLLTSDVRLAQAPGHRATVEII